MDNTLIILLSSIGIIALTTIVLFTTRRSSPKDRSVEFMNELIKEEEKKKPKKKEAKLQKKNSKIVEIQNIGSLKNSRDDAEINNEESNN